MDKQQVLVELLHFINFTGHTKTESELVSFIESELIKYNIGFSLHFDSRKGGFVYHLNLPFISSTFLSLVENSNRLEALIDSIKIYI